MSGGSPACMHTSVAPRRRASLALRTISGTGSIYPSSSLKSLLNAQNPHCLTQTLVKLMLRFTTYVTVSPALRRRISSAVMPARWNDTPRAEYSLMPSLTPTSPPERAFSSMSATTGSASRNMASVREVSANDAPPLVRRGPLRPPSCSGRAWQTCAQTPDTPETCTPAYTPSCRTRLLCRVWPATKIRG